MNKPKIILFDVGGVLIADNDQTGSVILEQSGLEENLFWELWPDLVSRYGSGKMSEQQLWDELARHGGRLIDARENSIGKSFEDSLSVHHDVITLARELKSKGIIIAILSNTVDSHAEVNRRHGIYEPFGDNVFLSHEIGIRKPDTKLYSFVLERLSINDASQVLFIDDKSENLEPAKQLGMQTILAINERQIVRELQRLL